MDSRIKDTIVRHDKGFNCAQAVACTYCDLLGYKEEDIFRMTEGFGAGMGGMQATCGALSGAVLLAGLKNSDVCCELKGITTGTPIHSCADCIMDAAAIVENVLFGGEE